MDGKCVLLLALSIAAFSTDAAVYKCADGVYQAEPCDDESEPLDLSNVGSSVANTTALSDSSSAQKEQISTYVRNKKIARQIAELERDRKQVIKSRDKELAHLRERGQWANNNLAGATWQQSLAQEMTAVTQQADTQVTSIDRQISSLRYEMKQ
ncbi:hypothetical protein [Shewanella sp. 10N.286.48.B5]|uniref:hypothetical protein n=1 Tax=Shewanella sp. 10N.286.48.B5 TaxID=1880834 RepID=UPI000C8423E2|nr:hypothetical protein [Shewanella sp. 10N.286.48.B5]PMH85148.1 hypothetical protein BCU57_15720 [Shewanella sp. 10N.286.48.B5]